MKHSTFQNCCMALLTRGWRVTSVTQVAKAARVSRSTAHRFFVICEKNDNLFVETKDGTFRKMHALRYTDNTKEFSRGVVAWDEEFLTEDDIIVRHGGII